MNPADRVWFICQRAPLWLVLHPERMYFASMQTSVTLTIKQVPASVAARLKRRAEANRRSLQKELLSIIEAAAGGQTLMPYPGIGESEHARYEVRPASKRRGKSVPTKTTSKLTLDQLWQRARKLGSAGTSESAAIIRRDRDGNHRR